MDTPRSASPVSHRAAAELDDHRDQPHSLPRSNTLISQNRPDFLFQLDPLSSHPGSLADNENAVTDDEGDEQLSPRAVLERFPMTPGRARAMSHGSNATSSSRSLSPPNSVEAFANPDRRRLERTNTVSSYAPSDIGQSPRRAERRPTFDGTINQENCCDDTEKTQQVEEDVCFPMSSDKPNGIDFEEMEEFVQEQKLQRKATYESLKTAVADIEPLHTDSMSTSDEKVDHFLPKTVQPAKNPDRFTFFSSELDSTVHSAEFGGLLCEGETFQHLFRGGESVWWLDCYNPTEAEMRMLMKAFGVHPLTAEDIRVQETREKVELFNHYYFVCFRSFIQDKESEDFLEPVNVYLVVFREGILTFNFRPSPHSANVRKRIGQLRDYVSLSSDWICYAMIDDITDSFGPAIHDVERESDQIEDQVFIARTDDFSLLLKHIGECRKRCMGLMRLLSMKADVIRGFAKRCNEQYSVTPRREIGLYLGDIQDHVVTMSGNITHVEKMLSRSHSNYLAQVSVEAVQANMHANEVLSKITLLGTILVPLNLICGLFGMNVKVPGMDTENYNWFYGICGVIGLIVIASLVFAKMRRLI